MKATFSAALGTFVVSAMLLGSFATPAATFTVVIDPVDYAGKWSVDGTNFFTGPQTLALDDGVIYTLVFGSDPGRFDFDIDGFGNVTSHEPASAVGGLFSLTFNNIDIAVDVSGYAGIWGIDPVFNTGNATALTLVPTERVSIAFGSDPGKFWVEVDTLGNVTVAADQFDPAVPSIDAASGGPNSLTFHTVLIDIDTGDFVDAYTIGGSSSFVTGDQTVNLVVGERVSILHGGNNGRFFVESDAAGNVLLAADQFDIGQATIPQATAGPSLVTFKTVRILIEPDDPATQWRTDAGLFRTGDAIVALMPDLAHGINAIPPNANGDFFVSDPCGVSPSALVIAATTFTLSCIEPIITVQIDVKPGSDPNCFNINGHGVVPVAILGSQTFNVQDIDTESLKFGALEVRMRGNKGPLCSFDDSNGDGYTDLVCQFEDDPYMWAPDPSGVSATLKGFTLDNPAIEFEGTDSVCVVP